MSIHAWADYQQIQILPALWAQQDECECCQATRVSINVGWLFWSVGIGFHLS